MIIGIQNNIALFTKQTVIDMSEAYNFEAKWVSLQKNPNTVC